MNTTEILSYVQIGISVGLILIILMQQGGSGLGSMFGGVDSEGYRSKRGMEALLLRFTIFLSIAFVVNALAIVMIGD